MTQYSEQYVLELSDRVWRKGQISGGLIASIFWIVVGLTLIVLI